MIEISTKLIQSISPPKLQIYAHNNQWFALNNSHLLVYRQLERVGLCTTVVCDIIRSQDVPIGIREARTPRPNGDRSISSNDQEPQSQDEVVYCADMQADSCGCLDDEDSIVSDDDDDDESDSLDDSDDEQAEWSTNPSLPIATISNKHFDLDDDGLEESSKEMQSLL